MKDNHMNTTRLIIVAVGGQGNLLTSRIIGEAALMADIPVRMSEIHGMAQRGGVVESAIVFGGAASSIISDGEADVLIGFEPSETLRALNKCNSGTFVITNMAPSPPFTVAIGRGTYPDPDQVKTLVQNKVGSLMAFDAARLAREAGTAMSLNIVLLGAAVQSGKLPVSRESVIQAIETRVKKDFVALNLKAFELGARAAAENQ